MNAFVGVMQNLSAPELESLLAKYHTVESRYFLRWAHKVSGIITELADLLSPEGQMFDRDRELRWKQQGNQFSVLVLSTKAEPGFSPISKEWMAQPYRANLYPKTETRFPKGIQDGGFNIGQRCFIDAKTATVHFVALTVEK